MQIELRQATRKFARNIALDSVSVKFGPGELVAVAGLAGSGKSALLRVLSGSIGLTSGERLFDGKVFCEEMEGVSLLISEPPPLLPDQTVFRNVCLFLSRYQKTDDPGVTENVMDLVRRFGLEKSADSPVASLSPEEAFKVGHVILAAVDPPVWLIDGPLNEEIASLALEAADRGRIVLYSARHIDLSEELATRVCLMNQGKIYADAAPGDLLGLAETDHLVATMLNPA